jgi:lipid II:glycine glycyltransferase (peptidoglycan interpeptide bridge formation enzyme)
MVADFGLEEEREFLNRTMAHFRRMGSDMVIPASNNAIFRTYPDGAEAAPYGSYVIDLSAPEDVLWRNMGKILRQNIKTAMKDGVVVRSGSEYVEPAYDSVRETFARSNMPFMPRAAFRRYVEGLGDGGLLLMAEYNGKPQSYVLFGLSTYSAYAIYAGNSGREHQGAHKLLHWEAIRMFRNQGVRRYDFMGARIAPATGSKQDAMASFKRHYGASLHQGFMWRFPIRPVKYWLYKLAARWRTGGDIVDCERHKLNGPMGTDGAPPSSSR